MVVVFVGILCVDDADLIATDPEVADPRVTIMKLQSAVQTWQVYARFVEESFWAEDEAGTSSMQTRRGVG